MNIGEIVTFTKNKDYIMVNDNLGKGSFGKTVLVKDPYIDELFVVKKYSPDEEADKERFYKNFLDEIKIMYRLNHQNIVRIYNYYSYPNQYTGYIFMEYIDGERIDQFFENYNLRPFGFPDLNNVFLQLIDGFTYMEENKIIHRDIREGNILIDNNGVVKIIDFGIGKIFENTASENDSLFSDINRENSDTLPQEYFEGKYTSKTDMFYIGELINRLIRTKIEDEDNDFSYQNIIEKMMSKNPKDRFENFGQIKSEIGSFKFNEESFTEKDKEIYREFSNSMFKTLLVFEDYKKFNLDINKFSETLENALNNSIFENEIQNNSLILDSLILSGYKYNPNILISRETVSNFLDWFNLYDEETKKLILNNLKTKMEIKMVEETYNELPFD